MQIFFEPKGCRYSSVPMGYASVMSGMLEIHTEIRWRSACTALITVIANGFQTSSDIMPIKSQFDNFD